MHKTKLPLCPLWGFSGVRCSEEVNSLPYPAKCMPGSPLGKSWAYILPVTYGVSNLIECHFPSLMDSDPMVGGTLSKYV